MGTDTAQRCDKRSETPKPRIATGFGLNKGGGTEVRTQERRQPLAVFKTMQSWLTMRFDGATRQTARQSLLDNSSADPPTAARDRLRLLVSAERGVCGATVSATLRDSRGRIRAYLGGQQGMSTEVPAKKLLRSLSRRCPRQESNLCTRFRKPLLYPLSYGGAATAYPGLTQAPA